MLEVEAANSKPGTYTLTVEASDGVNTEASPASGVITIEVTNLAPVAFNRIESVRPGQEISGSLLSSAFDPDEDELKIPEALTGVFELESGTLTIADDGSFTFIATGDATASETFEYKVTDGAELSQAATLTLRIDNAAPTARNITKRIHHTDMAGNDESVSYDFDLAAEGSNWDPDGDEVTFELVSGPSTGSATLDEHGEITLTTPAGFVGEVSFTYKLSDGALDSETATVRIIVENETPTAFNDRFSIAAGDMFLNGDKGGLSISGADLLRNDFDFDGDDLKIKLINLPQNVLLSGDPEQEGEPAWRFHLDESKLSQYNGGNFTFEFEYEVSDGAATDTATVFVEVYNSAPIILARSVQLPPGESTSIELFTSDLEGDAVTISANDLPAGVTLNKESKTLDINAAIFTESASFEIIASDGFASSTATVAIDFLESPSVTATAYTPPASADAPNSAPVAIDDGDFVVTMGRSVSGSVAGNDYDLDGDQSLTYHLGDAAPSGGKLSFGSGGSFTYTPNEGFVGQDSFTYYITDSAGGKSETASVSLLVTNRAPEIRDPATNQTGGTLTYSFERPFQQTTLSFSLIGDDPDGHGVTFEVTDASSNFTAPSQPQCRRSGCAGRLRGWIFAFNSWVAVHVQRPGQ